MKRTLYPELGVGLLALLLVFSGAACDTAPGPYAPDGSPPVVSALSFSPEQILFESLGPDQLVGDSIAVIDLDIQLVVTDVDSDIDSVVFAVQSPFEAFEPLARGRLVASGIDVFSGGTELRIPRGDVGLYSIVCFAVDRDGHLSNQARGLLRFEAGSGSPPVIEDVEGPSEITPPTTLTFVAVVSDPDGLNNVVSVVVRPPNGGDLDMFDDGASLGDEVAGDGRYTARFDVPSADPGTFRFAFQAFDRFGLASEIVTRDVTVVE